MNAFYHFMGSKHYKDYSDVIAVWVIKKIYTLTKVTNGPVNIYLFQVNNRSTRNWCEICSELTIKKLEWCQWRHSGVFIVNFEHTSHHFLLLLFDFEQVNFLLGRKVSLATFDDMRQNNLMSSCTQEYNGKVNMWVKILIKNK